MKIRKDFLPFSKPAIGEKEIKGVVDCLKSGWITTGPVCKAFEDGFRELTGASHAVSLTSATAGMHLALLALGIGEKDEVITPSMTWHDHTNETKEPMFWLDGLDIPIVQFFDASFAEGLKEDQQKITKPAGDSFARYGHNLLPVDQKRASKTSPIFNYPYHYTREALEQARSREEWDACHGLKLKFSNPETGDFAMPTIGTFIQLLPKGFKTARYRSTDATVFAAIEGKGRTRIGDKTFEWGPLDLFVVPSWQWVTHEASEDAVLFSFSDRPVQQKLDLFREDRGNA